MLQVNRESNLYGQSASI